MRPNEHAIITTPNLSRTLATPPLRPGDHIRFVSPASTPDRDAIALRAREFESWGLKVSIAEHAFKVTGRTAGTDAERLDDLNAALRDPQVRAVVATRGGMG